MEAREQWLVVPRTARYALMGDLEASPSEVWLLCHGYGQLASEFIDSARALAHPSRLLVAPEGLSRFYHEDHETVGASWMTREDREREMDDYVRYLDLLHEQVFDVVDSGSTRLMVLGFSQGAATAARYVVRGRASASHLIMWGAAMPPELDDDESFAVFETTRLTLVTGTRDELFPDRSHVEQCERLRKHGVAFSELRFEGGHRLDDHTLHQLAGVPH